MQQMAPIWFEPGKLQFMFGALTSAPTGPPIYVIVLIQLFFYRRIKRRIKRTLFGGELLRLHVASSGRSCFVPQVSPLRPLTFLWASCSVLSHLIALLATTQHSSSLSHTHTHTRALTHTHTHTHTHTSDTHTPENFHTKAPPQSY